jgi:RNA polymerase sigma-B factor
VDLHSPADEAWLRDALDRFGRTRDLRLRDEIARHTDWLAARLARRFVGRGEPYDDLLQAARIGLLKAIERFDPELGLPFGGYATPTILGELRRHFRDHTWSVHVSRRAKDLRGSVAGAVAELTAALERSPTVPETAAHLRIPEDTVVEVMEAGHAYRPAVLDPMNSRHELVGRDEVLHQMDRVQVVHLLEQLPARERTILYLRYFERLSQAAIAAELGLSQVHVGRLIAASLIRLRDIDGPRDG